MWGGTHYEGDIDGGDHGSVRVVPLRATLIKRVGNLECVAHLRLIVIPGEVRLGAILTAEESLIFHTRNTEHRFFV